MFQIEIQLHTYFGPILLHMQVMHIALQITLICFACLTTNAICIVPYYVMHRKTSLFDLNFSICMPFTITCAMMAARKLHFLGGFSFSCNTQTAMS